ncbi:hypothetical protein B0H12DRAFT_1243557 [Mycena haematopus]|nr:hypothetical protein B0H12DRAFT_1243557 [Mycena haematopus]
MARAGTAERRWKRLGLSPVKPGKKSWIHGSKLVFFEGHKDVYLAAAEMKQTGSFYQKLVHLYLAKYGYNTAWDADLQEDQDVADDVDEDEDVNDLSAEEAEERAKYFQLLKTWYNGRYGGSVEGKKKKVTFKTLFDKPELKPPAPVKPRILHFYSRRFYNERVKDCVTARWAAASRLPSHERPKEITIRAAVTKECWAAESDDFKREVELSLEKEHAAAMEAYECAISGDAPTKPQEYDIALHNAAYYLQPFADAARERFGMNVAILLCGPIADRGGRIEVRSVHAGMTKGVLPRVWSDYDRGGFDAAQQSFVEFSHQCFTEAECRARALDSADSAEAATEDGDEADTQSQAPHALRPPSPGTSTVVRPPTPDIPGPRPHGAEATPKAPEQSNESIAHGLLDGALRGGSC